MIGRESYKLPESHFSCLSRELPCEPVLDRCLVFHMLTRKLIADSIWLVCPSNGGAELFLRKAAGRKNDIVAPNQDDETDVNFEIEGGIY